LWENFASYTKKLENITLQVYWDTQLKKKESILFFKRFRSSIAIRTIPYFDFTNRDNDVMGGNLISKHEF
jgi:hypothetical protein